MPILGGSPLGIIGVESRPSNGMSTFNGGRTRNVNVNFYNSGRESNKEKLTKAGLGKNKGDHGAFSLFTGDNNFKAWPNIGKSGSEEKLNLGLDNSYNGVSRRTLHNNDVYDTSVLNIIDKTANTAAQLRPSDFAYLKNIGVFPNNRLMIARRFRGPAPDDIFGFKSRPIACLISWKKQDEDFLDITFGEEWEEAKADFKDVLNNISKDLLGESGLGNDAGAGFGVVPLPGWTEYLQQRVLESAGIIEPGSTSGGLQVGNPNIIKQARRRKTVASGAAGSGLTCTVSIKMTCEYEQKFISGIDPTIAYMDILSNIVRFGTSPHVDYGLSKKFGAKLIGWVRNPRTMISDVVSAIRTAVTLAKDDVLNALQKNIDEAPTDPEPGQTTTPADDPEPGPSAREIAEDLKEKASDLLDKILEEVKKSLEKTVQKYEEEIKGIVNALTLNPSTPWHITLGNPLRPVFSSGDMLTTSVTLTLGPNLAFNDLPSSIKVDFTLANARPWGLGEILGKFNSGHLRVVNVVADAASLNPNKSLLDGSYYYDSGTSSTPPVSGSTTTPSTGTEVITGSASTTKENSNQASVNSNPNSTAPVVQGEPVQTTGPGPGTASTAAQQTQQQASVNN
jgi:hypothetical protein